MIRVCVFAGLLFMSPAGYAATYYISPTGSNSNNGLSSSAPFLTFAYAINAARAWCGDTLVLLDGTYGDGTSTGRLRISGVTCTISDELTVEARNQRKAKIQSTTGSGQTVSILSSAYIILDGLYAVQSDNSAITTTDVNPLYITSSNHITVKNGVFNNPNRYTNSHSMGVYYSQDVLLEDNESYIFHRHCVIAWQSQRVVARRIYCNPRGGAIPGGNGAANGLNRADALMSMYPCKDCIVENSIADGTTSALYLAEANGTYGSSIVLSGSKILGSICYKCNYGNGIYLNARTAGMNYSPQNITIRDVAFIDQASGLQTIRASDVVGGVIDHVTAIGTGAGLNGIVVDDTVTGDASASLSTTITDSIVIDMSQYGFRSAIAGAWSGSYVTAFSNGTNFSPTPPSNWTNTSTSDPGLGTCKVWIPAGSAAKGSGSGGSDRGATILYRYVNGVLTDVPLWDTTTGAFPYGGADSDGTNRVSGDSLFDFHVRININTNGCLFPAGYGSSGPSNPSNVTASSDVDGGHVHVVPVGIDSLTVFVDVRFDGSGTPAHATSVTSSCGNENIPLLSTGPTVTLASSGNRSVITFGKINPTSGSCTLTPVFSSSNVSGWVITSIHKDNVASYGLVSGATQNSTAPSVTVSANSDHVIISGLATSNSPTLSVSSPGTLLIDKSHPTKSLRGASSELAGSDGVIVSYNLSSSVHWALQAVALIPPGAGGGSASTFRVTKYRIEGLYGLETSPEVALSQLATDNAQGWVSPGHSFRLRAEILVENSASQPVGIALFCRTNSGPYLRMENTFGSSNIRLYGPGFHPFIPSDNTPTTQRFSGTFHVGITKRDASVSAIIGSMAAGTRTEVDYQIVIGNAAAHGDLVNCEIRRDDGAALGVHTVLPTISVRNSSASMGF